MVSRASSWDFNTSPSMSSSPTRSSLNLPVRSPSILSQLVDPFPVDASRSRSSSRLPSQPHSPLIPLRQWAEQTATERQGSDWRRSASETGRKRNASLRRGHSISFDGGHYGTGKESGSDPPGARRLPSMEEGLMSPLIEASAGSPSKVSEVEFLNLQEIPDLTGLRIMTLTPEPVDAKADFQAPKVGAIPMSRDGSAMSSGSTHTAKPALTRQSTPTISSHVSPTRLRVKTDSPQSLQESGGHVPRKGWFKGLRGKKQNEEVKHPKRWGSLKKKVDAKE